MRGLCSSSILPKMTKLRLEWRVCCCFSCIDIWKERKGIIFESSSLILAVDTRVLSCAHYKSCCKEINWMAAEFPTLQNFYEGDASVDNTEMIGKECVWTLDHSFPRLLITYFRGSVVKLQPRIVDPLIFSSFEVTLIPWSAPKRPLDIFISLARCGWLFYAGEWVKFAKSRCHPQSFCQWQYTDNYCKNRKCIRTKILMFSWRYLVFR